MQISFQRFKLIQILVVFALIVSVTGVSGASAAQSKYEYYVVGSSDDATTSTTAGQLLMGGGTDVDAAFVWMINKSGGGDFVVIRAAGTDAYNPYIYELGSVDSVETIIIKKKLAHHCQPGARPTNWHIP